MYIKTQKENIERIFNYKYPYEYISRFDELLERKAKIKEFYDAGAGIIRLWENWLDRITPADVKGACPNAKVFIMACRIDWKDTKEITLSDMDGSGESCRLILKEGFLRSVENEIMLEAEVAGPTAP